MIKDSYTCICSKCGKQQDYIRVISYNSKTLAKDFPKNNCLNCCNTLTWPDVINFEEIDLHEQSYRGVKGNTSD